MKIQHTASGNATIKIEGKVAGTYGMELERIWRKFEPTIGEENIRISIGADSKFNSEIETRRQS